MVIEPYSVSALTRSLREGIDVIFDSEQVRHSVVNGASFACWSVEKVIPFTEPARCLTRSRPACPTQAPLVFQNALTTAPHILAQDPAERAGGLIIHTARATRIHANLPKDLWPEIVHAAAYLLNRTPIRRELWKTPFELATGLLLDCSHLRMYGCTAYIKTNNIAKKDKLRERAKIGHLIGWDSAHIFRI
nr:retrovirus-related pol polyprotein from transposon tnt 1-94 [Quercus suber]